MFRAPNKSSLLLGICLFAGSGIPAIAQSPDFSVCEGFTGQAAGLCKGGVAAGCDIDDTGPACEQIAELFTDITGAPPPWTCPCNFFSTVPMNSTNWGDTVILEGACDGNAVDRTTLDSETTDKPGFLRVEFRGDLGTCRAISNVSDTGSIILSPGVTQSCFEALTSYAQALDGQSFTEVIDLRMCP